MTMSVRGRDAAPAQPTMALAVRTRESFLEQRLEQIRGFVSDGVDPRALIRFAVLDLQNSEKLQACTQESIYLALLACAVTGLEPGSIRGEAYLVPFAKVAQFVPGWRGLVKLARESGLVKSLVANVVCERDDFEIDLGTANRVVHRPLLVGDRGPVVGAYAIATMGDGFHEIEWVDRHDLEAIKAVATKRGASPAWADWEDQMFRKSAIKRLAKRLPLGKRYAIAQSLDDTAGEARDHARVIDVATDGKVPREILTPTTLEEQRAIGDGVDLDKLAEEMSTALAMANTMEKVQAAIKLGPGYHSMPKGSPARERVRVAYKTATAEIEASSNSEAAP